MVTIRNADAADCTTWLQLRRALWPDGSEAEHREEIKRFFEREFPRAPKAVLLAEDGEAVS